MPGIRAGCIAADLMILRNSQKVDEPQDIAGIVLQNYVLHVVAREAFGIRHAGHDGRPAPGFLDRDAHRRVFADTVPCDIDRFAFGEIDVVGRAVQCVAADGHVAQEVERAEVEDAAPLVAGDAAGAHSKCAGVTDATAGIAERVTSDIAVPKSEIAAVIYAATGLAALMGNLADGIAGAMVGNGQGRTAVDLDGIASIWPGDVMAIETKVDVGIAFPCGREGHVAGQVIVARGVGQAVSTRPRLPRQIVAMVFRTSIKAADLVSMLNIRSIY